MFPLQHFVKFLYGKHMGAALLIQKSPIVRIFITFCWIFIPLFTWWSGLISIHSKRFWFLKSCLSRRRCHDSIPRSILASWLTHPTVWINQPSTIPIIPHTTFVQQRPCHPRLKDSKIRNTWFPIWLLGENFRPAQNPISDFTQRSILGWDFWNSLSPCQLSECLEGNKFYPVETPPKMICGRS